MNQAQILFRFKDKENLPANKEAVRAMHKDIQTVRLPRQAQKRVLFAFAEFGTEEKCEEAKVSIYSLSYISSTRYRFVSCLLFLHIFSQFSSQLGISGKRL